MKDVCAFTSFGDQTHDVIARSVNKRKSSLMKQLTFFLNDSFNCLLPSVMLHLLIKANKFLIRIYSYCLNHRKKMNMVILHKYSGFYLLACFLTTLWRSNFYFLKNHLMNLHHFAWHLKTKTIITTNI